MKNFIIILMLLIPAVGLTQEWQRYHAPDGSFRIDLPGAFVHNLESHITDLGDFEVNSFIYKAKDDDLNFLYLVNYFDYPENTFPQDSFAYINELLSQSVEQSAEDLNGKLIYSADIEQNYFPAKISRIEYAEQQAVVKSKMVLASNRFYSVQVYSTIEKSLNDDIDRFLDSFEILDQDSSKE